jgi:hypothetical protein
MNDIKLENVNIISFDIANKSLGIAQLEILNINKLLNEIKILINNNLIKNNLEENIKLLKLIKRVIPLPIKFLHIEVSDLIPGKKIFETSNIERSYRLYLKLNKLCQNINKKWLTKSHILIEYQMGQNKKTNEIVSQIIYHFLKYLPYQNIHIIGPSLKNKLYYFDDKKSIHNYYINKYNKLYTANKAHTTYIFKKIIQIYKLNNLKLIKKSNYSDIADAICQAIAWVKLM